jgi:hypothetical protein
MEKQVGVLGTRKRRLETILNETDIKYAEKVCLVKFIFAI